MHKLIHGTVTECNLFRGVQTWHALDPDVSNPSGAGFDRISELKSVRIQIFILSLQYLYLHRIDGTEVQPHDILSEMLSYVMFNL